MTRRENIALDRSAPYGNIGYNAGGTEVFSVKTVKMRGILPAVSENLLARGKLVKLHDAVGVRADNRAKKHKEGKRKRYKTFIHALTPRYVVFLSIS